MNELDLSVNAYTPASASYIENELILNWYPGRIISRKRNAQSLLELGLGHGFTAGLFSPHFRRHVILEGAKSVIDLYRAANPAPSFEIIETFFEDYETREKFDVIVMGFILEHVNDPGEILSRYRTLLTPGGRLYVAVPNAKCLNRLLGFELGLIKDIYELNDNDRALGHKRQYCLDTLRKAVADAGYKITHQEGIYLKPLPMAVLKTLDRFEDNLKAMLNVGVNFPQISSAMLVEAAAA